MATVPASAQTGANRDKDPAIVGGTPTTIERHPWQVALSIRGTDGRTGFCGGSILHHEWILTAAHCVVSATDGRQVVATPESLIVRSGSTERLAGKQHAVTQVFVHEGYNPPLRRIRSDDIALLKLKDQVDGREIMLSPEDVKLAEGDVLELTGWGSTHMDASPPLPTILQRIELPYISFDTCNRPEAQGGQQGNITHDMLCVGATPGHGQCGGDSGGPLVRHTPAGPVQVGVVSFSSRPCTTRVGVFTRVSSYRGWIARVLAFN